MKPKKFRAASHLPILSRVLQVTKGPVLELGAGYFSTPFMYWVCKEQKRKFVSYENDLRWCKKLYQWDKERETKDGLASLRYVKNWDDADIDNIHWSVVFIDHRPALRRKDDARRLKDNADYILMHDSEPEINKFYKYNWVYDDFKYKYDYTMVKPHTVILSNFKKLKWIKEMVNPNA